MINPNHELFIWGPIPGKPIYPSIFMMVLTDPVLRLYPHPWPEIVFHFQGGKMTFICDDQELKDCGEKYLHDYVLQDQQFELVKKKYGDAVNNLHMISSQVHDLQALSDTQLTSLFTRWQSAYFLFWAHGLVPEMANWGGERLLKQKLHSLLGAGPEFIRAFERLTAPEELSFYQKEELSLFEIKERTKTIQQHQQDYFWIDNSYYEIVVLDESHFQKRLKKLQGNKEEILALPQNAKEEKEKITKEFNLPHDIVKLASRLSYCIYWQDDRKGEIFRAGHYLYKFIREVSRRKKIKILDLEYYWGQELKHLFEGTPVPDKIINKRQEKFAGYYRQGELVFAYGDEYEALVRPFVEKDFDQALRELKGTVASIGKGKIQGTARILHTPREADRVQKGDILIAPMTSPEYIVAMRKAAAIVTDEGGMTSHAAIVSRELNLPCIVGTRFATKLFKDGEAIEVDPEEGTVRKHVV